MYCLRGVKGLQVCRVRLRVLATREIVADTGNSRRRGRGILTSPGRVVGIASAQHSSRGLKRGHCCTRFPGLQVRTACMVIRACFVDKIPKLDAFSCCSLPALLAAHNSHWADGFSTMTKVSNQIPVRDAVLHRLLLEVNIPVRAFVFPEGGG